MTTARKRRTRYQALRTHDTRRAVRRGWWTIGIAAGLLVLTCTTGMLVVSTVDRHARATIGVASVYPGDHDGVCDAPDGAPEWFADSDCTDPAYGALVDALCVGPAGIEHGCLINTVRVRPCSRWDGAGTVHPCAWNSQAHGVGDCPALSGLTRAQCLIMAAGRVYVYV